MAKKSSSPARATKLDVAIPLKAAVSNGGPCEAHAQLKLVGSQKDRGQVQLVALRRQIKADAGTLGGRSTAARASIAMNFHQDHARRHG
jgi:hypothetical protein